MKFLKPITLSASLVLGGALLLPAQQPAQQPPQQPPPQQPVQQQPAQQPEPQVVAKVNGDAITATELQVSLQAQTRGQQVPPDQAKQLQQQALSQLVEARLVEQYVLKEGPEVKDQEVQQNLEQFRKQVEAQQIPFARFLQSQGHTEQSIRKRIRGSLAWQKFQQEQLTDEQLQAYFRQNKDQFQAEDFEQARPEVAQAYLGAVWENIVQTMRPEAKIEMASPPAGQGNPGQGAQPAPNGFPPKR